MQFAKIAFFLGLAATSLAAPIASSSEEKRASAGVLKVQAYAAFQVSDGVAGNALAEVNAKFPVSFPTNLIIPNRTTN
jgi:hypothetical protein